MFVMNNHPQIENKVRNCFDPLVEKMSEETIMKERFISFLFLMINRPK